MDKIHKVVILNFGHPMADWQLKEIDALLPVGYEVGEVINIPCQIDNGRALWEQVAPMLETVKVKFPDVPEYGEKFIYNPPALPVANAVVTAKLLSYYGLSGFWIVRMVSSGTPPKWHITELM